MKNLIILFVSIILCSCTYGYARPEPWQNVSIVQSVSPNCKYIFRDACKQIGVACVTWYRHRAASYGADSIVLLDIGVADVGRSSDSVKQQSVRTYPLAEYYKCGH